MKIGLFSFLLGLLVERFNIVETYWNKFLHLVIQPIVKQNSRLGEQLWSYRGKDWYSGSMAGMGQGRKGRQGSGSSHRPQVQQEDETPAAQYRQSIPAPIHREITETEEWLQEQQEVMEKEEMVQEVGSWAPDTNNRMR